MNSKTEFLENISSPEYVYLKIFVFEICRNEEFSIQKLAFWNFSSQISIVQENVCFRIWFLFFWKFHFKLWFSMKKFATKSSRLKSSGKLKKLFIVSGANRVKTLFLKCDVLIEIWFFIKNWTQNLIFR